MKDASPFQLILLGVFFLLGMAGLVTLMTYSAGDNTPEEEQFGQVRIWGTYDARVISTWLQGLASNNENIRGITYQEFSEESFDRELLEALAEQRGPDLLLLNNYQVHEQRNRLFALSPDVYPIRDFRSNFVQMAEVYENASGILGLPLFSDPLVLLWNRTLFQSASLVTPPASWQEYANLVDTFTERQDNLVIQRSALAAGETTNIPNAEAMIFALAGQSQNPLTATNSDGERVSILSGISQASIPSVVQGLEFFLQFSDPSSPLYSWNRSLPDAQSYFVGGNAATYVGFASEIRNISQKNPNLNFDVAELPQSTSGTIRSTYADLYGLFMTNGSNNKQGSLRAMAYLTSRDSLTDLQEIIKLGVVRRDMASQVSGDELFTNIFARSSIYGSTFIAPSRAAVSRIFTSLVSDVTSGARSVADALNIADADLNAEYSR